MKEQQKIEKDLYVMVVSDDGNIVAEYCRELALVGFSVLPFNQHTLASIISDGEKIDDISTLDKVAVVVIDQKKVDDPGLKTSIRKLFLEYRSNPTDPEFLKTSYRKYDAVQKTHHPLPEDQIGKPVLLEEFHGKVLNAFERYKAKTQTQL
ncbi:MAG TPA: hypothetical protein VI544_01505 [Candidatus Nanoarchaeia archaeon]|nr:hypothetical protein [Candidatus Woesearchaeota archaeon]HLF53831.1 hypothetical protein [Candidatus Nanoarchaeia archaeon]